MRLGLMWTIQHVSALKGGKGPRDRCAELDVGGVVVPLAAVVALALQVSYRCTDDSADAQVCQVSSAFRISAKPGLLALCLASTGS